MPKALLAEGAEVLGEAGLWGYFLKTADFVVVVAALWGVRLTLDGRLLRWHGQSVGPGALSTAWASMSQPDLFWWLSCLASPSPILGAAEACGLVSGLSRAAPELASQG